MQTLPNSLPGEGAYCQMNPSPGAHLTMLATLSHKGRGEERVSLRSYLLIPRCTAAHTLAGVAGISM